MICRHSALGTRHSRYHQPVAFANVNGVVLHYELQGEGQPVLLIPDEGMGAWSWFRQVPPMKRLARVVVFDPRGIGESHAHQTVADYDIATMAHDAVGLLQTLDFGRTTIVGVGLGGFVALQLALERPELVARLVLISTALSGDPETFLSEDARRLRAETAELSPADRYRHEIGLQVAPGFTERNPGLLDTLVENRRQLPVSDDVLLAQRDAAARWTAGDGLSGLGLPVLVIVGQEDRFQQPGTVDALAAALPNARFERVARCGHLPYVERPEVVNHLIMSFVQEEEHPAAAAPRWRTAEDGRRLAPDDDWELKDGKSDFPAPKDNAPAPRLVPLPKVIKR